MSYGLKNTDIGLIIYVLSQFPGIEKAILYGLRATRSYKGSSGINFAFVGDDLDPAFLNDIAYRLSRLSLPYVFDLKIYNRIENFDLIDEIDTTGMRFYTQKNILSKRIKRSVSI